VILESDDLDTPKISVPAKSNLANLLGQQSTAPDLSDTVAKNTAATTSTHEQTSPAFETPAEQKLAQITYQVIQELERQPELVPTTAHLQSTTVQALVKEKVQAKYQPEQLALDGVIQQPDIDAVIAKTTDLVLENTIDIPRIIVVPQGEVKTGFHAFRLDLEGLNFQTPSDELVQKSLSSGDWRILGVGQGGIYEDRLENYIVAGLIDFDDIAYDDHADLLYDLATQVVIHFQEV